MVVVEIVYLSGNKCCTVDAPDPMPEGTSMEGLVVEELGFPQQAFDLIRLQENKYCISLCSDFGAWDLLFRAACVANDVAGAARSYRAWRTTGGAMDTRSSLFIAIASQSGAIVSRLLTLHADVNEPRAGTLPSERPLHCAVRVGNLDTLQILLEGRADVSMVDHEGNTALHIATWRGIPTHIEGLLLAGADQDHLSGTMN